MMSVPVMSAGMRSGVNWMRRNDKIHAARKRADHRRFRQAGHAFEQAVAAREDGDEELLDDVAAGRR